MFYLIAFSLFFFSVVDANFN